MADNTVTNIVHEIEQQRADKKLADRQRRAEKNRIEQERYKKIIEETQPRK